MSNPRPPALPPELVATLRKAQALVSRVSAWKEGQLQKKELGLPSWSFLRGSHFAIRQLFRLRGYHFEVRRAGETKLGLWRKAWSKRKRGKHAIPRRLVIVPGFGDTPLSWLGVMTLLSPYLRSRFDEIVFLDFPGFGGFLSAERAFPSLERLLEAVSGAFDSLRPEVLIGHSLGGYIVARYAAELTPEELSEPRGAARKQGYHGPEQVIVVNPTGVFDRPEAQEAFEKVFRTAVKDGFEILRPHVFAREPLWFRFFLEDFARFYQREDISQFIASVDERHRLDSLLGRIHAQVGVIWGEKDSLIPVACAESWMERLPRSEGVILRNLGHSPQVENPAVTATALGRILAQKPLPEWGGRWWKKIPPVTQKTTGDTSSSPV